jgi:peptidylprolyl isomerase
MQRLLLIIAACLALVVAGCGDDSSTTAETAATTTEEQASPEAKAEESEAAAEKATEEAEKKTKPTVKVSGGPPPKKLVVKDLEEGTGPAVKTGDEVSVHYVLVDYKSGREIEASWDLGQPIAFPLGSGSVIPGWEQGLKGMKVGGRRELVIPPALAYGPQGSGPIGPNATLVFVVDLMAIN